MIVVARFEFFLTAEHAEFAEFLLVYLRSLRSLCEETLVRDTHR